MQKALTGPKHSLTFRNKYLAVVLSVAAFLLSSVSSFGQGAAPPGYAPKVFSYGNWYNRLRADSAVHIPNKAGLFKNDNDTTPQLFVFNDTLRMFANGTFRTVGGTGSGGTNIFNSNGRIPNGVTRRLSGGDRAYLYLDSLVDFGITDSLGRLMFEVDPINSLLSLSAYGPGSSLVTNLSLGPDGVLGLSASGGLEIGDVGGSIASFSLKQQSAQGATTTLRWPVLDNLPGDTLATKRDVRVASNLDAVLGLGDTAYQKDIVTTWDSQSAAFNAGFARRFLQIHADSLGGTFDVGDVDGNRTALFMFMSQRAVGVRADSGFQIGGLGNSRFNLFQTQAGQTIQIVRLRLPNTGNFIDTVATLFDVRNGGGGATIPPNVGSGYRFYAPQTPGFKSFTCTGCTLDSATTGQIGITVTDATISTSNITTNNATTSKHGFVPILPNDATKYYDGTGVFSTPPGGSFGYTFATAVNTSNYTVTTSNYVNLPDLTGQANRNVVLPSSPVGGQILSLENNNTPGSTFSWIPTNGTIVDWGNNTITTIPNLSVVDLVYNSTTTKWKIHN